VPVAEVGAAVVRPSCQTLERMTIASRMIRWGLGASLAAFFLALALLSWLEGSGEADGPGVGLGLAFIAGITLVPLLAIVFAGTLTLGAKQCLAPRWFLGSDSHTFWLGAAYSLAGIALVFMWLK